MEKCWFTLTQTHYSPPTPAPTQSPSRAQKGPIQLGHLLPRLTPFTPPINSAQGPLPLPPHLPIYPSRLTDLRWTSTSSSTHSASASALLPIPQALGLVSGGGGAGVAFQKSVKRFWCFEALDTEIFLPDEEYIEDSLEVECVKRWVETQRGRSLLGTWSLFMITGLAIARGVRGEPAHNGAKDSSGSGRGGGWMEESGYDVGAGPEVSLSGLIDAGLTGSLAKSASSGMAFGTSTDFVWAIQVTKISKRFLSSGWTYEPYVKGATYSVEDEEENVEAMLAEEGVAFESVIRGDEEDDVYVVTLAEESKMKGADEDEGP